MVTQTFCPYSPPPPPVRGYCSFRSILSLVVPTRSGDKCIVTAIKEKNLITLEKRALYATLPSSSNKQSSSVWHNGASVSLALWGILAAREAGRFNITSPGGTGGYQQTFEKLEIILHFMKLTLHSKWNTIYIKRSFTWYWNETKIKELILFTNTNGYFLNKQSNIAHKVQFIIA